MTDEEMKAIIQEEMNKAITTKMDSAIIFKYISNLEKEIEKKDKIIDLMAKYISETDMEEDICFSIDCDENTDVDTGEIDCKTCIKEYFKKKVSKP